ncbi:hypothetical protein C2W64_03548 [Brevibacillus laterosporus]|nr:hypothetical protein C2W64_03548 [Brevibacillus laterosporus]
MKNLLENCSDIVTAHENGQILNYSSICNDFVIKISNVKDIPNKAGE